MSAPGPEGWEVVVLREPPAAFHARAVPDPAHRSVWVCEPTVPSLVLGSTQSTAIVDATAADRAGLEIVRRRSGGGAVLVVPGDLLWLDVILPAGDPLWVDDVGRAAHWVGQAWQAALASLGVDAEVHRGPLVRTAWSDLVCFAGLGPGELTVPGGAKAVGISQRRTRSFARFQCAALLGWDPSALVGVLDLEDEHARAFDALADAAAAIPVPAEDLLAAVLQHLP